MPCENPYKFANVNPLLFLHAADSCFVAALRVRKPFSTASHALLIFEKIIGESFSEYSFVTPSYIFCHAFWPFSRQSFGIKIRSPEDWQLLRNIWWSLIQCMNHILTKRSARKNQWTAQKCGNDYKIYWTWVFETFKQHTVDTARPFSFKWSEGFPKHIPLPTDSP